MNVEGQVSRANVKGRVGVRKWTCKVLRRRVLKNNGFKLEITGQRQPPRLITVMRSTQVNIVDYSRVALFFLL